MRSAWAFSRAVKNGLFSGNGRGTRRVGLGACRCLGLGGFGHGNAAVVLGQFDGLAPPDLNGLDVPLLLDAILRQHALGSDAGLLHLLVGHDIGHFGLTLALGTFAGQLSLLLGPAELQFLFLGETRIFTLPFDIQAQLFRFQVLAADLDQCVLFDVVACFLALLDLVRQPGQALGIERIGGVEVLHVGLVEINETGRFKFEAVLGQRFGYGLPHRQNKLAALFVEHFQGHAGGRGPQGIDEFAFHHLAQFVGLARLAPEGLRGNGDALRIFADTNIKINGHVHAHAILGDQGLILFTRHRQSQGVEVDLGDIVENREHIGGTVDDDLLPPQSGANEGDLLGRSAIKGPDEPDPYRDDNDRDDDRQDNPSVNSHGTPPVVENPLSIGSRRIPAPVDG